jgi:hypothetical protein
MADLRAERNGDDIGLVAGGDQRVKRAAFRLLFDGDDLARVGLHIFIG